MVHGCGLISCLANRAEALIGAESVGITRVCRPRQKAWVRRHNSCRRLVDVGLSLQMQAATRHISHTHERLPEHLALVGDIPSPRFRRLEASALRCDHTRNVSCTARSRGICQAIGNTGVWLERWIPAEEDRVAYAQTGRVTPGPNAKHRLLVELISNAKARLDFAPLDFGVVVGDAPAQATEIELSWVGFRNPAFCGRGEAAARNNHAVISICSGADNKASFWINRALDETVRRADCNGLSRIIKPRVKNDHVPPQGVIRNNDGIADAEGKSQILPRLPSVLREPLPHVGAKDGVRAMADFRIGVEQA